MVTIDLKALIARQMRLLAVVAAIAGLAVMMGAKPAHAQYSTTGTISASPLNQYLGQPVNFTVQITVNGYGNPPFGQVDLYDGFSTVIASYQLEPQDNGVAHFTISTLSAGTHYLVGYYEGFGDLPAGSTSNDVKVTISG